MNPEELFANLEKKYELPSGYLARTYQVESGGGKNLYNRQSGAAGPFQFIPRTASAFDLKDPYDLAASADAAARLAVANRADLRAAGIEDPTGSQLYLAHQQGARGATKLLFGGDTPAAQLVGRNAVLWNAGKEGMTGPQFAELATAKYESAKPAYTAPTGQPGPAQSAVSSVKVASADKKSLSQFGGLMGERLGVLGQRLGLLQDGSKVPFNSERPYSPPFQEPTSPMGAAFAGSSPAGGVGSVPGGAAAALTSRPLPAPESLQKLTPDQMRGFAALGNLGMSLMAAGAPKQSWTPGQAAPVYRGRLRDDIFAGLLG